jgi:hypothetical protein
VGPKDVKGIASIVGSRNATQARTHAQKYFLKLARMKKCAEEALKNGSPGSIQESWLQHVSMAYAKSGGFDSKRSAKDMDTSRKKPHEHALSYVRTAAMPCRSIAPNLSENVPPCSEKNNQNFGQNSPLFPVPHFFAYVYRTKRWSKTKSPPQEQVYI